MMLRVAVLACVLGAATLCAAPLRFARPSESVGSAEIQFHPNEPWRAALRNTPIPQGARLRTADSGRLEVELDEGSVVRLAGDAVAEMSDYTQLSTGQRISLISVDHGTVYFAGRPGKQDSLSVAAPGAQITFRQRARLRFEVNEAWTQISVLEGQVRFATPSAELEIREGQLVRLDAARAGRFQLLREIPQLASDDWSMKRDAAQEASPSNNHLPGVRFGATDLDLSGSWLQTDDAGLVWKPKVAQDWAPFQRGIWRWYDELGYTWIAAEEWGWAPYHFGRWLQHASLGWVWAPGKTPVFKPGEVYWMRSTGLALWGALAPDEWWTGAARAQQFAALNTTAARFEPGQRELDATLDVPKPKDLMNAAKFTVALPSPALPSARLDEVNPPLHSSGLGAITFAAPDVSIPGASYEPRPVSAPPATVIPPQPPPQRVAIYDRPVYVEVPEPVEIYFAVPVYSGVVILNPAIAPQPKKKKTTPPDLSEPAPNGH